MKKIAIALAATCLAATTAFAQAVPKVQPRVAPRVTPKPAITSKPTLTVIPGGKAAPTVAPTGNAGLNTQKSILGDASNDVADLTASAIKGSLCGTDAGTATLTDTNKAIVAQAVALDVGGERCLKKFDASTSQTLVGVYEAEIAELKNQVRSDVNGDGKLTVADADGVQTYAIASAGGKALTQLKNADGEIIASSPANGNARLGATCEAGCDAQSAKLCGAFKAHGDNLAAAE